MDQNTVLMAFKKLRIEFTQNLVKITPNFKSPLTIPISKNELETCIEEGLYGEIKIDEKTKYGLKKLLATTQSTIKTGAEIVSENIIQKSSLRFQFIRKPVTYIIIDEYLRLSLQEYSFFIKNLFDNLENNKSVRLIKYNIESSILYVPGKKLFPVDISTLKAALKFYLKHKIEIDASIPPVLLDEIQDIIYDVMD